MVVVEEKERRRVNAAGLQLILPEMFQRRVAGPWSCEWAGYPTLKHFGQYHLQPSHVHAPALFLLSHHHRCRLPSPLPIN